jgi:hypothetical protein
MILYAPENEKTDLFKLAKEKLKDYIVEGPLYKDKNINDVRFSRSEFEKTGSKIILIGGELKDKTIIRHITPEAFAAWQKLYEDWKTWGAAGFDYVPIEPIQSFKLGKDGLVSVYSGVLDLSLSSWGGMNGKFMPELRKDKEKIIKTLDNKNIEHGHMHDNNFCLRFFRDKNGKVDFDKKPRIYLIDFDQAISL